MNEIPAFAGMTDSQKCRLAGKTDSQEGQTHRKDRLTGRTDSQEGQTHRKDRLICHSRESGNLLIAKSYRLNEIPAFTGMTDSQKCKLAGKTDSLERQTLRKDKLAGKTDSLEGQNLRKDRLICHSRERGNLLIAKSYRLNEIPAFAGRTDSQKCRLAGRTNSQECKLAGKTDSLEGQTLRNVDSLEGQTLRNADSQE